MERTDFRILRNEDVKIVRAALVHFQRANGYPPTIRELAARLGINAGTLLNRLNYLLRIGSISQTRPHSPRCYYVDTEPNPWMTS